MRFMNPQNVGKSTHVVVLLHYHTWLCLTIHWIFHLRLIFSPCVPDKIKHIKEVLCSIVILTEIAYSLRAIESRGFLRIDRSGASRSLAEGAGHARQVGAVPTSPQFRPRHHPTAPSFSPLVISQREPFVFLHVILHRTSEKTDAAGKTISTESFFLVTADDR